MINDGNPTRFQPYGFSRTPYVFKTRKPIVSNKKFCHSTKTYQDRIDIQQEIIDKVISDIIVTLNKDIYTLMLCQFMNVITLGLSPTCLRYTSNIPGLQNHYMQ